ncbi:transmembrane protein 267 [Pogona vitticeps]|uniref:Transmembrane protein 267 n=1 Tax=Pogona vitticeps TaxID=103695 RepID=A0A6J0SW62_9SAUR|nr:transmembrane protein 267 [Pogona vitticeps]XP_020639262.1 transmembrane protein 267 [Pogona vitticeps]XP_020639263.1 transmembrane protein 267 [Pogona vitticeps]XP_020639264.1 transmembrane protein 267 [Pogona vitticeps]XP_020639265.1 transmembrane protein 267 [Pogona vitticeps]XP_020639266.1 transmembrane protein 267 [Pogona vitticeps]XP_020639267.1 transmembrane protein 267 [Pogona vitticeps]XP_020639268.1 transmembrane protein 267 [Pogona vitticeps]
MLPAMASESEKAHALLQSFSTASAISSLGLGIFCFVADKLLQFSFIQQNDWLRALSDNTVHGVVGLWSWAIVIGLKKKSDFTEVMLAGFLSSVIDVDHFILAGSLSLKAAFTLPRRPFLHCSTVIPVACLMLKLIMHLFKLKDSWCFLPWMLFISWTSHHVRDGIRHGLWICPFGKTVPLPYWLYVAITASLPHLCSFIMYLTGTRELMLIKHGFHIDV